MSGNQLVTIHEMFMRNASELRLLLADCGLSQRAAALKLEVSDRDMRYWCSGKYIPPAMVIMALKWLRQELQQGS